MAGDELTDAEKAYLESGGEQAEGLLAENKPAAQPGAEGAPAAEPEAGKTAAATNGATKETPVVEAADDDDDDDPRAKDPKATVPYPKYQRQRKKDRAEIEALKKQLSETNERTARGDERLKLLTELLNSQPQQAEQQQTDDDPEPNPDEDIIGWAKWAQRARVRDAQTIEELRGGIQQTQGTLQESAAEQQTQQSYQADAMAFAREHPDFLQAYNHLITTRAQMLIAQGHTEQQVRQFLRNEEKGLVQNAIQAGKRPAEQIYNMAKFMGYAPKPAPQNGAQAQNGNGAAPAQNGNGQQAPARQPSVVEEIERIQRGQATNKSLSDSGGAAQELTVEAIANMSERDFQALYAKQKAQIDNLMGKVH